MSGELFESDEGFIVVGPGLADLMRVHGFNMTKLRVVTHIPQFDSVRTEPISTRDNQARLRGRWGRIR